MWQYKTQFSCPDCGEHVFQTDVDIRTGADFAEAECTNCGHALTAAEIDGQLRSMPANELQDLFSR